MCVVSKRTKIMAINTIPEKESKKMKSMDKTTMKKEKKKKHKKFRKQKDAGAAEESVVMNVALEEEPQLKETGENDVPIQESSLESANESKRRKEKKSKKKKRKAEDIISEDTTTTSATNNEEAKKNEKSEKKKRKKSKKSSKEKKNIDGTTSGDKLNSLNDVKSNSIKITPRDITATANKDDIEIVGGRIVSFSASVINEVNSSKGKVEEIKTESKDVQEHMKEGRDNTLEGEQQTTKKVEDQGTTLLLFYQYIEPMLDEAKFQSLLNHVQTTAEKYGISGRARVAYEGLNCTLTGSYENIRLWCKSLRSFGDESYFGSTEFKLTDDLPPGQAFTKLHVFKVDEIVNYGLAGERAPKIDMTGVHLEPKDYHRKMMEDNTVIIDVRNHYEAAIGKFTPPENGAQYIDPNMRKSTEFPVWLDKPETKEMLRGKQVLMYCTGRYHSYFCSFMWT